MQQIRDAVVLEKAIEIRDKRDLLFLEAITVAVHNGVVTAFNGK